jgi:hypothetical protein
MDWARAGIVEALTNAAPTGREYLDVLGVLFCLMRDLRREPCLRPQRLDHLETSLRRPAATHPAALCESSW